MKVKGERAGMETFPIGCLLQLMFWPCCKGRAQKGLKTGSLLQVESVNTHSKNKIKKIIQTLGQISGEKDL